MKTSTKRIFFTAMTPVLVFIVALSAPSFLTAQSKPPIKADQSLTVAPTAKEVSSWAKTAREKLPAGASWDKAKVESERQRALLRLIKRGQSIVERAAERGETMSATEAANYDDQLRAVVEQMDKLSAGAPAKESPSSCFGGCDGAYKGWGKGKGWNRFWCKVACFKIEVHIG
jgi:hypothetical protein